MYIYIYIYMHIYIYTYVYILLLSKDPLLKNIYDYTQGGSSDLWSSGDRSWTILSAWKNSLRTDSFFLVDDMDYPY